MYHETTAAFCIANKHNSQYSMYSSLILKKMLNGGES